MKVSIVITNLEVSGTFKYLCAIAEGFRHLGWTVQILYSGLSSEAALVEPLLHDIPTIRYTGNATVVASRLIQAPIIRLFLSQFFTLSQSVNLLGQLIGKRAFLRSVKGSDVVVYSNFFATPAWTLLDHRRNWKSVIIFHEGLASPALPAILRTALRGFAKSLASRSDLCLAVSSPISEALAAQGLTAKVHYPAFWTSRVKGEKENIVLADTRWNANRDPLFALELAVRVPAAKFVLTGRIHDPHMAQRLEDERSRLGLSHRLEITGWIGETQLHDLYAKAKIVARWGKAESGFPVALSMAVSNECVPVLSRELGGATHLAEEVSPDLVVDDVEDFARVLRQLLSDERYYSAMRVRVREWKERRPWVKWVSGLLGDLDNDWSSTRLGAGGAVEE